MASYAWFNLTGYDDGLLLPDTQHGVSITEVQKGAFIARYDLIDQHANDSTGFSATLFYDKIEPKGVSIDLFSRINAPLH